MYKRLSIIILFFLILVVTACTPGAQKTTVAGEQAPSNAGQPAQAPARLEALRIAGGDFGYPTPFLRNQRGNGYFAMTYIYDTLVWKDSTGQFIPWLAESWNSSPDGITWTFKLRSGVKWQDGEPFSAEDVAFSYRYLSDNKGPSSITKAGLIKDVQAKDNLTVQITLGIAYAPFLRTVAGSTPIIPKHIWADVKDPLKFNDPKALIGTGPYRLTQYSLAEGSYLFEANDDFFLGKPYVRRLEFIPVSSQSLSLRQGDLDVADISGYWESPDPEMLKTFNADPKFAILTAPGEWNLALFFGLNAGAPLNDKVFRQAVAYALDLQTMVDKTLLGHGTPGDSGWAAPTNPWKNPDVKPYPYNLQKAQALLDQAGYKDGNGDGKREGPDGKALSFELLSPGNYTRVAEMVKTFLGQAGIEISIKTMDMASVDKLTTQGKYQMALIGYGGLGGDPEAMSDMFSSKSKMQSFRRVYGYNNARFDELATKQVQTVDEAARKQMVYEMQSILAEDLPIIILYFPERNTVFNKTVLDTWYYTPGGFGGGVPTVDNKHVYVTGEKTGLTIRGTK